MVATTYSYCRNMSKGKDMSYQQSSINTQPDWTIIQITDTHLMYREELEFAGMNRELSCHEVMEQIQQRVPSGDALIHTGDLAPVPVERTYQRYVDFTQF